MKQAAIYQVKGPFKAGENAIASLLDKAGRAGKVRIGISIDTRDWLPLSKGEQGFSFVITGPTNTATIQMGRSCMYESDQGLYISSIVFNKDAPQSTIINIVGC